MTTTDLIEAAEVEPHAQRMAALADSLQRSERLRQRRFEMVPLRGAVSTDVQGRGPGPSVSAEGLADLISSISSVGVLHPVLLEELTGEDGSTTLRLVLGERRYRACRWGAVNLPENPYFAALPAVICPGPLTVEERRTWQLIENLAREDLQPGELAAALLLERCAILQSQLETAGESVSGDIPLLADPVARFEALEKLRGTDVSLAAPWPLVLRRLGLQITPRRARELVAAFRTLPRELSSEMDEQAVSLAARTNLVRISRGRREAAADLWQAVKRLGRPDLLTAAAKASAGKPSLSAEEAAESAAMVHERANATRSAKLTRPASGDAEEQLTQSISEEAAEAFDDELLQGEAGSRTESVAKGPTVADHSVGTPVPADLDEAEPELPPVAAPVVRAALEALRALQGELTAGRTLHRFDAGSLSLLLRSVGEQLKTQTS